MKNSPSPLLLGPLAGVLLASLGCLTDPDDPDYPDGPAGSTSAVTIEIHEGLARVEIDGEPFTTVHHAALPKPFLFPVLAPGGVPVTRSWPMTEATGEQRDHPHHQSLWFAHGDVNGYDFWHGSKSGERIELHGEITAATLDNAAELRASYRWIAEEEVVCREERRLVFRVEEDARIIDIEVRLTATENPLILGDTKEGTMALRLHPALRLRGEVAKGAMINSEGASGGECWGKRARWMECSGPIDGQPVGVAILDHPSNPHHPTWWHARDYGLVAANPFGVHDFEKREPGTGNVTVDPGESIVFRYRILLHAEAWAPERIEAAFTEFAQVPGPEEGRRDE
jgi:hypothetical protein